MSTKTSTMHADVDEVLGADWWRQAVVYQIYPRSFADSNGDGIGDLPGITARVPYLTSLGIDAVWLSPFYPSALADGGYDVDDYRDVDPRLGTLADFDDLVAALHDAGIKLIVDIVPNHTSDRHAWFQEALAAPPGSPARDRYIFRDGNGPDGSEPPSDWDLALRRFGLGRRSGRSVVPAPVRAEQPDLNWDNPEVRDDFLTTLRFWSDRGVDGFRVDVAHALVKDLSEPLPRQGRRWRRRRDGRTAPTRSGTGTRCTRSTPSGAGPVQRVRPAPDRRRRSLGACRPARRATPAPRASARRSTSTCCRPTLTPDSSAR